MYIPLQTISSIQVLMIKNIKWKANVDKQKLATFIHIVETLQCFLFSDFICGADRIITLNYSSMTISTLHNIVVIVLTVQQFYPYCFISRTSFVLVYFIEINTKYSNLFIFILDKLTTIARTKSLKYNYFYLRLVIFFISVCKRSDCF